MSDTNRISSMLAWNFTDILWAVFYVLGTFAAMLALNWRLALAVIAIVPVMAILTGYFQNRILHWNRKVRKLNPASPAPSTRASPAHAPPRRW